MPLTPGWGIASEEDLKAKGFMTGENGKVLAWKKGFAKAGVIMPDGTERKVLPPVQIQNQPSQLLLHVQFYVTIILVSAMVATGVFYGMKWLEKQEIK
jgi:hypothetical protein